LRSAAAKQPQSFIDFALPYATVMFHIYMTLHDASFARPAEPLSARRWNRHTRFASSDENRFGVAHREGLPGTG
jgi:hypothetical protein